MGHFNEQFISDCDSRTSDDDYLDRRDGVSSKPSLFTKTYTPSFDTSTRRRRFVGIVGAITDESGIVLHSALYDNQTQSETDLNALAHELLMDYAERGLTDTVPVCATCGGDGDCPDCDPIADIHTDRALAEKLAQSLANTTRVPTHVVQQGTSYLIQDDDDLDVYFAGTGSTAIVATFQLDDDPAPGIENEPPEPPVWPGPNGRAVTLQSIQIDGVIQRNRICKNPDCQGPHYTWQCPQIGDQLLAIYDTAELAQLWATSRTLLAAKLARLTRAQLHTQAIAFAAWLDTRTHSGLSAASVLHIWETFILDGGDVAQLLMRAA